MNSHMPETLQHRQAPAPVGRGEPSGPAIVGVLFLLAASGVAVLAFAGPNAAGWAALLTALLVVLVVAHRFPAVRLPLYVGLGLRAILMVMVTYGFDLPARGDPDRVRFEADGWALAQHGIGNPLDHLATGTEAYHLIIAVCYLLAGRDPMVPATISVLLGTLCILEVYRASMLLWGDGAARRAAWAMALLPAPVTYSAFLLREGIVVYLVARGARHLVQSLREQRQGAVVWAFAAFAAGGILHAGITWMLPVIAVIALTNGLSLRAMGLDRTAVRLVPVALGLGLFFWLYQEGWGLDKFQSVLHEDFEGPIIRDATQWGQHSVFITQEARSPLDLTKQTPLRLVLFIFSPFPWMIRRPAHLLGVLDVVAYWYVFYRIIRNMKTIRSSPAARGLLFLAACLLWVYAMGTSSFGQGIRHRLKSLPMLLSLAVGEKPCAPCSDDITRVFPRPAATRESAGDESRVRRAGQA